MKTVSGSNNDLRNFVVNMVGCVTAQEPMLLVLGFVKHGDLQSYVSALNPEEGDDYTVSQMLIRIMPVTIFHVMFENTATLILSATVYQCFLRSARRHYGCSLFRTRRSLSWNLPASSLCMDIQNRQ